MILDADELDELQQDIADIFAETMPDRCSFQRTTIGIRDPENPEVIAADVENLVYDDVPCSYREATPREVDLVGQQEKLQLLAIEIAPIYHVNTGDSGTIKAKGDTPEIAFEVIAPRRESNATAVTVFASVI